jgi:tripartite-type tricarboxylate transporter receptor subunit TctC
MRWRYLATAIFGAFALGSASSALAAANPDAEFFRGKTITYIIATAPGGGYDTYGRLLVRFMEKHMPGTRILVRNVPGAGNIVGTNTIYTARPDGLTFGNFNNGLIYSQILKMPGVRFDLSKMSWIGKMASEGRTLVLSNNSGFDSVDDLINSRETIRLASSGIGAASDIETRMLQKMLRMNVRLITNIEGNETQLSMLRGEVAGVLEAASSNEDFVRRGSGKFVLAAAGAYSLVPGVPQARSYVTNPEHLRLLDLIEKIAQVGRPSAGPPGIPVGRLAVLREVFMKATTDPELLAQARTIRIPIEPSPGDVVARTVAEILAQPPNVVALLKEMAEIR